MADGSEVAVETTYDEDGAGVVVRPAAMGPEMDEVDSEIGEALQTATGAPWVILQMTPVIRLAASLI